MNDSCYSTFKIAAMFIMLGMFLFACCIANNLFAQSPELRDVREAAIDTLRETPKSEFPADGVLLRVSTPAAADVKAWHFRTGVPFGVGALNADDWLELYRGDRWIPMQTEVLATWGPPDSEFGKAVKWLGVDFVDAMAEGESPEYRLKLTKDRSGSRETSDEEAATNGILTSSATKMCVIETASSIEIDNGRLRMTINKTGGFNLFESVTIDGRQVVAPGQCQGAYIVDGRGRRFHAKHDRTAKTEVEMSGPFAAVVRAEGWFVNPDVETDAPKGEPSPRTKGGFCRFVTRIFVAANQPDVRVQHTFILTEDSETTTYRDIGVSLPIAAKAKAMYGGVEGEHGGHTYLLQESWDKFTVNQIRIGSRETSDGRSLTAPATVVITGNKADGWAAAGDIAVGVRDFWQNFPKELEVDPAAGEMRVHLWPDHGIPRKETTETLSDENVWRLPFVHSGDELDFRVPKVLDDNEAFPELNSGAEEGYIENMYLANAIGISRTHDLLISFESDRMPARMALFDLDPHALPDANCIASTGVFGPIPAADPDKRPLLEHRYNTSLRFLSRSADLSGSFGMWNYRDLHTYLRIEDVRSRTRESAGSGADRSLTTSATEQPSEKVWPGYRRLWAATHYNYPRVAWWQYWRAGDHEVGLHARRETSHIMDVDICHWTNAEFANKQNYESHKRVGGLCDYKGVVHWNAGARNAYNACIDFMLYDFYFRGNRRAWDVAMEHGRYVQATGSQNIGRGAAGQADTLIELYQATWDPSVGERLKWHVNRILQTPPGSHDQKLDWTPWITRYWDLTHDPAIEAYLMRWLNDYGFARDNLWAYGYYIAGNEEYANKLARSLFFDGVTTVKRDDAYDGMIGRTMKPWADKLTASFLSLNAADAGQLRLRDFQPAEEWPYWVNWGIHIPYTLSKERVDDYFGGAFPWPEEDRFRITSYVYHDGSPKKLWLGVQNTAPLPGADVELFSPNGERLHHVHLQDFSRVIRGSTREGPEARKLVFPRGIYPVEGDEVVINGKRYPNGVKVDLETRPMRSMDDLYALCSEAVTLDGDDPRGFYKVVHSGVFYTPVPILPPGAPVWLKVGAESTISIGGQDAGGVQFFYVPPDCERFELAFLPTYEKQRFKAKLRLASGAIVNPDAKAIASISCGLETKPQVIAIDVPPEHRGKAWAVAGQLFTIVDMKGVPPYISPSFDAVANPPHEPDY